MPQKLFTPRTLLALALFSLVTVIPFLAFADSRATQTAVGEPFVLAPPPSLSFQEWLGKALLVFAGGLAVLCILERLPAGALGRLRAARQWCRMHPQSAVALCALASVVASSYPVVFLGKSFVSPNMGAALLYERFPTLPGYSNTRMMDTMSSDVGAIMWQQIPMSVIEHQALLHDHELPLWNRYSSCGFVLLGQGQSMFGDPLHMALPVLFNGASWAWDLKFLFAKALLALGLGLVVWQVTRHLPAALLVAFAADFVGFFNYRIDHPSFFNFCYAIWILYFWIRAAHGPTLRSVACWTLGLIVANGMELTGGAPKEAAVTLLTMNLTGFLVLAFAGDHGRRLWQKLGVIAWGGVLFVLISMPIWLTFLDALRLSRTNYNDLITYQIEPSLLLGLFDEIFFRPFNAAEQVFNPAANFVVLLGVIGFLVYLRDVLKGRAALAVSLGAIVSLVFAFGLVPPLWLSQLPFVRNIVHVDDCFAAVLILQLAVLAGIGFAATARRLGGPSGRMDVGLGIFLLFALIFPYLAHTHVVQRGAYPYLAWGHVIHLSPYVWASLVVLPCAAIATMIIVRRRLVRGAFTSAAAILLILCLTVLLWRSGLQAGAGFADYVVHPPVRVDFHVPSPAVEAVKKDRSEPFRAAGFDYSLSPGWTAVYGIEGINGPDALMNRQYRELIAASGILLEWGWRTTVQHGTFGALRPIYDFLNIKYYFDDGSNSIRQIPGLQHIASADLEVYRSPTAWPRAFYTNQLLHYSLPKDLVALIQARPGHPFAAVQDNEHEPPVLSPAPEAVVPARNYRLTADTTSFDVDAPGPGVIVLQEAWVNKDFKVTLNGRPASYFRVNHAFKGVAVNKAGRYRVAFKYWPREMTLSLVLAGIGMAGLLGSAGLVLRRK